MNPKEKLISPETSFFTRVPGMAHISEVERYLQPRAVTPKA